MRTLLVDNYDSYTFNLFQLIAEVTGEEPLTVRNDHDDAASLAEAGVEAIVISPGPGHPGRPDDFGVCTELIRDGGLPTLGVCLGHQGLGLLYGGRVTRAPEPVHGGLSRIEHTGRDLFAGIPQGFEAVRYHSLVVDDRQAPELERIAWTEDGLCMGLRHRQRPLWGVQFHPESILTEHGRRLLANFMTLAGERSGGARRAPRPTGVGSVVLHDTRSDADDSTIRVESRRLERWVDPWSAFTELFAGERAAFWLDSSMARPGMARFSFMGSAAGGPLSEVVSYRVGEPLRIRSGDEEEAVDGDLFDYLDERLSPCENCDLPFPFTGGWVGYLGYELKADTGGVAAHRSDVPDAQLIFADRVLAFDHVERAVYLVGLHANDGRAGAVAWLDATERTLASTRADPDPPPPSTADRPPANFRLARGYERYVADVEECIRLMSAGESYEICLTNTLMIDEPGDPLETYRRLRAINPAPYSAFLSLDEVSVLSSSPERFLRLDPDGRMEAKPIKGTAARDRDPVTDERLREALRESEKDRAENLMIVDLLRNDLGEISEIGSVHVPGLMEIESYETVHQMVSTVRGRLRSDLRPVDCVRAAFPGGSMTGAPKVRTMEIIDELEDRARGVYSGAIGYFSVTGAVDLSIVIRTIVQTPEQATIGAGGAVVVASDPVGEYEEMLLKARAPVEAVEAGKETR